MNDQERIERNLADRAIGRGLACPLRYDEAGHRLPGPPRVMDDHYANASARQAVYAAGMRLDANGVVQDA